MAPRYLLEASWREGSSTDWLTAQGRERRIQPCPTLGWGTLALAGVMEAAMAALVGCMCGVAQPWVSAKLAGRQEHKIR